MTKKKLRKSDVIRVRVTAWEFEKLKSYADSHETTVSDVVRKYIHRLPVQGQLKDVVTAYLEEQR
jgi:NRPS condensation-like uncharacterized protein